MRRSAVALVVGADLAALPKVAVGLLLAPVGAAVGGAKGAAEAQTEDVVDATRADLRLAMQDTDFAEDLRTRLAASTIAGVSCAPTR
mgnify:CR=1 FL=1